MAYRVLLARPVPGQLDGLPEAVRTRVLDRLRALADAPRPAGCAKLAGDVYRIRAGDYRAVYQVSDADQTVLVLRVVRRSEKTYRRLP